MVCIWMMPFTNSSVSGQSRNLLSEASFINFIECFRKLAVENADAKSKKTAKDFLPSRNTLSKRIGAKLDLVKVDVVAKLDQLKKAGGGLTLDYAKKDVDYLAVTANFIDENWSRSWSRL